MLRAKCLGQRVPGGAKSILEGIGNRPHGHGGRGRLRLLREISANPPGITTFGRGSIDGAIAGGWLTPFFAL
jgi:hypothetical protein